VPLIASRRSLTDSHYDEGITASYGQQLGRHLAARALEELLLTASTEGRKHAVHEDVAADAVRDAITQVSRDPSTSTEQQAPAARVVVLIPDIPYVLRRDLGIEVGPGRGGVAEVLSTALRELGIGDGDLASHVAGTVDRAIVIKASALERRVLVINLARFGRLHRVVPSGSSPAEPVLTLIEPGDPVRPPAAGQAVGPASTVGGQPDLLKVQITLSISGGIEVDNASAARVIKIE
jgi:hypothetical protein